MFKRHSKGRVALITAAAMLPTLTTAQNTVSPERLDLLVSLICAEGGSMQTSKAAQILPQHGFDMAESQAIIAELEARSLVKPSSDIGTIKLKRKACR